MDRLGGIDWWIESDRGERGGERGRNMIEGNQGLQMMECDGK